MKQDNMSCCCFLSACQIKFGILEIGPEMNGAWGKKAPKIQDMGACVCNITQSRMPFSPNANV